MSRFVAALSMLAAAGALAAEPETPAAAKPRTFALVSAVGAQFTAVHEVTHVGSHLSPYRRDLLEAPGNVLNKLVLHSLDDAVAKIEPASKRIYLAVATVRPRSATFSMETAALEAVVAELRGMPDRTQWDRVVVATPAYRGAGTAREALPDRLQGIGIVTQSLCQGEWAYCDSRTRPATAGLAAVTPEGEPITVSRFVAPFMSIKVWILDPKTLEVLDVQEVFEHQKLFDPKSDAIDMNQNVAKRVLATRIVELVEHATREAVMASELRGNVEIHERGVAKEAPK
jgi:hypothetical protein